MAEVLMNLIQSIDPQARVGLAFTLLGCTTGIVIVTVVAISSTVAKVVRGRVEAGLKRDMLDRGFTADEIATVVGATGASADESNATGGHAKSFSGRKVPA